MVKTIAKVFFLPLSTEYWFITCYILLCLLVPVVNPFLQKLTIKNFILFLSAVFCLWYLLATFLNSQYANLMRSFMFWCLGSFFGRFTKDKFFKPGILISLCFTAFLGIAATGSGYYFVYCESSRIQQMLGFIFVKAGTFLSAVSIFLLFKQLNIGSIKAVNLIATCTFGVYLIHEHPFVRPLLWYKLLDVLHRQFFSQFFILYSLFTVFTVFIFCAFLDFCFRKLLEEKIYSATAKQLEKIR